MSGRRTCRVPLVLTSALVFVALVLVSVPAMVSALETHGLGVVRSARTKRALVVPLTVHATLADVGYVGVILDGPPGASVQLSDALPKATKPIQVVKLGSQGARSPHALMWSCAQRRQTLMATTLPPAMPQRAKVSVMTPACSTRLAASIPTTASAGRVASIIVQDRWRTGGLPFTVCATPPGATTACKQFGLGPRQSRLAVRVAVPRAGGWRFAVKTRFGSQTSGVVWVGHPQARIRLLATGDSEMQVLDGFIAQDLAPRGVDVINDARSGTGLTLTYAFNWESHAHQEASAVRPDATVVFMGANDAYITTGPSGRTEYCCGAAWSAGYANLVAEMMRSYLRGNAGRVYWFVLPAPRPPKFKYLFDGVNAGIRLAAARFPGRVALIDTNAFFTPGNRYRDQMTFNGFGFTIHQPDGIHLSAVSDQLAAALVVKQLVADRVIK